MIFNTKSGLPLFFIYSGIKNEKHEISEKNIFKNNFLQKFMFFMLLFFYYIKEYYGYKGKIKPFDAQRFKFS